MTFFRIAIFAVFSGAVLLGAPAAAGEEQKPMATGLNPITPQEEAWMKKTWKRVERVGLNELGLKRSNEARKVKGLAALAPSAAVPMGEETTTTTGTAASSAPGDAPGVLPSYVDTPEDASQARAAGADVVLEKSIDTPTLVAHIHSLVNQAI